MGLGHGEHRIDGLDLGDGDDAVGVRRVDHIAPVGLAQAQPARNGRRDARVAQLQLGRIGLGLVGGHRALVLAHQRSLGIDLLAGNGILGLQLLVALQVQLGVLEQRLVALQRALDLVEAGLEAARIDLGQQLAGLDLVAFLEMQAQQLARHLGAHHGRGARVHGADGADQHAHVAPLHHAHGHRLRLGTHRAARAAGATRPARTALPTPTASWPAAALRGCAGRGLLALRWRPLVPPPQPAPRHQGQCHHAPHQGGPYPAALAYAVGICNKGAA